MDASKVAIGPGSTGSSESACPVSPLRGGSRPGALVISLDFELHWGVRDRVRPSADAAVTYLRTRRVVPRLAALFADRGISATWATVGFLFAGSRDEIDELRPAVLPAYAERQLDPYREPVGPDEEFDPLHLAASLVDLVASTPGQEIGSHTFSHFYCLERGQDEDAFRADLAAAQAVAARRGMRLRSLVLPRNQWNPAYRQAVVDSGFTCYRGPQPSWAHRSRRHDRNSRVVRVARLLDTYVGLTPPPTIGWDDVAAGDGLCNVPASAFLRPFSSGRSRFEPLRHSRLVAGLRDAAARGRLMHLWWHPHNFAAHPEESFAVLERLLDEFDALAESDGMQSLSMGDVAASVLTPGSAVA